MARDLFAEQPAQTRGRDLFAEQPKIQDEAILEAGAAVGSTIATTIGGGLAGLASAPFVGADKAADIVKDIQSNAFQPKTEGGKLAMEKITSAIKSGVDFTNASIGQLATLGGLLVGQSDEQAIETYKEIKKDGISKYLGENTLEATGSPLAATVAHSLPTLGAEVAGFKMGRSAPKAGTKIAEGVSGVADKALDVTGTALAPVVAGGKGLAETASRLQTPGRMKIARQLQKGKIDADTALFRIVEDGVTDPTAIQKLLGADIPKIAKSKPAAGAANQGFSESFLGAVTKRATPADLKALAKMTNISSRGTKDVIFKGDFRPADVAGKVLLDKVNEVKRINRLAGNKIGEAKKSLIGKEVPVAQIGDSFLNILDDLKIVRNGENLDFSNALVSGAGRRKALADINKRMTNNLSPKAIDLHELKLFIDDTVSYGKSVRGLGGQSERALKKLRANINDTLNANFKDYAKANKAYSDSIGALDEIQRLAGKRTDLTAGGANSDLGTLARRLTSQAQSRGQLRESLHAIDDVLKTHGSFGGPLRLEGPTTGAAGTKGANLKLLMAYADELDRVIGNQASTSFTGAAETAIKAARGPREFIADKAVEVAKGVTGVTPDNAFKSMREFIKSEIKAKGGK